jgi:hypothetical protein
MATRARIGILQKDGSVLASYQHWDGYPGGLGYNLVENWTDTTKVTSAIKLGNASKWGIIIGTKVDFDDRHDPLHEVQNVYYMRDRGEKDQGPTTYFDELEYLTEGFNSGEEYIYLMKEVGEKNFLGNPQGTWFYAHHSDATGFKPVEEVAIKEHIESLQRYLKDKKERKAA